MRLPLKIRSYKLQLPFSVMKVAGSQSSLPGLIRFRVDRVSLGQLPSGFLLRPGPVPSPGRPGPGLTCQSGFQNYA